MQTNASPLLTYAVVPDTAHEAQPSALAKKTTEMESTNSGRLNIGMSQQESFAESNLVETMKLANLLKNVIEKQLPKNTCSFPFHDRVLDWLVPSMREDIVRFHGEIGPQLSEVILPNAIAHLDHELYRELRSRAIALRPDIMSVLDELEIEKRL